MSTYQSLNVPSRLRSCCEIGWPHCGQSLINRQMIKRGKNRTKRNGNFRIETIPFSVHREQSLQPAINNSKLLFDPIRLAYSNASRRKAQP